METSKMSRHQMIKKLEKRDGKDCFLCGHSFLEDENGKPLAPGQERTIEHWYPQSWCFAQGWTFEQVWDLKNLRLAHKSCNAKKGDLVPVDETTVPKREPKDPFRSRHVKRQHRPDICDVCNSGRKLGPSEVCGTCGSGPMPVAFPAFAKAKANECDHDMFWCWCCSIGIVTRKAAIITVLDGEYLDE